MYGSASNIPADYTVEVRDLIVGTQWKAEERDRDIPRGYTRQDSTGYARVDEGHQMEQSTPVSGTMQVNESPEVEVRNQKGWGLTVKKIWTDADFMQEHDPIYFAVYLNNEPVNNTVRRMNSDETELYYFFQDLKDAQGTPHVFPEYTVREVVLENPVTDSEGKVTSYDSIAPVDDGETLVIGGTPASGTHQDGFTYTVHYEVGDSTGKNENIRTDTVTNSRPGIKLYKSRWNYEEKLAGAVFTLKDGQGKDVAAESYTSKEDGLITIAYLNPGTYTLTETETPKGYTAMPAPMTITVNEDHSVEISGVDKNLYWIEEDSSMTAVITIRNRTVSLKALKEDGNTHSKLQDVHFALYREVLDNEGHPRKDYNPLEGYEDLVTDENGVIPQITMDLAAGTYYLQETQAPDSYTPIAEDLHFTIGKNGTVTILNQNYTGWLKKETDAESGELTYILTVPNSKNVRVKLHKTDMITGESLKDAVFSLYADEEHTQTVNSLKEIRTDENGVIDLGSLMDGTYYLSEDSAPAGYIGLSSHVVITVETDKETGKQVRAMVYTSDAVAYDAENKVYTLTVPNNPGVELPHTGGIGTGIYYVTGFAMILAAGWILLKRKACA